MDSTASARPAKRQRTVLNSSDAAMTKATKATKETKETTATTTTTTNGPVDSVDLRLFMSSLQREMGDLHRSIKASKDSRVEKAFQRLPRGMRRRTASHNAKRLPRRLRQQARRDQTADNTPSVAAGLAKRKKAWPAQAWVHEKVKRRAREHQEKKMQRIQLPDDNDGDSMDVDMEKPPVVDVSAGQLLPIDRLKLPTHLWMAKRAHIACPGALWHSLLVQTPADKTYRASLRSAGLRPGTCLSWDTSYMAVVRLQGTASHVHDALSAVIEPHLLTRRPALRTGAGCLDAQLPRSFRYQQHDSSNHLAGPGNCGALTVFFHPVDADTGRRAVFLRVHPLLFSHVWTALGTAVDTQHLDVALHDFRMEIGSIDLTGSDAVAALLSVLRPTDMSLNPQARAFWRLRHMDATALAPASGVLLAFDVQDPRYDTPDELQAQQSEGTILESLLDWPGPSLEDTPSSGLYDDTRRREATWLMSQQSLDRRRGKLPIGRKLLPTPAVDHPIPVLLAVTGAAVPATTNAAQTRLQHAVSPSWTLLAPRGCIDVLWRSLHSGTPPAGAARRPLLAGLDEEHAVALERGRPWFPADFPGTPAGWDWELESRRRAKAAWDKTPPAKKPNWDTVGELGSGFACDWEHVFGVAPVALDVASSTSSAQEEYQFEALQPNAQPPIVQDMCHVTWADLQAAVADSLRLHRPPQWSTPYALVTVAVEMLGRGTPLPRARVFRLPSGTEKDLRRRWRALADEHMASGHAPKKRSAPPRMPPDADMDTRIRLLGQSLQNTRLLYPRPADESSAHHLPVPGSTDLMGFVTSGAQRFQTGKGFGIGHVSAQKLAESVVEADKEKEAARLCIVRNVGETVGWLARWTVLSS